MAKQAVTTTNGDEQPQKKHPMVSLREQLESRTEDLRMALPAHIPPDRFIRVVLTAVQLNLDLLTVNRQSLWNACIKAAQDGLLPDGRDGAIVPFRDNNTRSPTNGQQIAQWMPMVGGLLKRFRNSGKFKSITANVVREGEDFRYWIDGSGEHIEHSPEGDDDQPIVKAYAMAQTLDGGLMVRVMSKKQIDKRRNVSRAKDGPMWKEWYEEAAMKTVLRALHKKLPSSADLDDLLRRDDELYEFNTPRAEPANVPRLAGVRDALEQFGSTEAPAAGRDGHAATDGGSSAPDSDASSNADQPQETEREAEEQRDRSEPNADQARGQGEADSEAVAVEVARQRGAKAKRDGLQRKALPPEYRVPVRSAEATAWYEAWDKEPAQQSEKLV